MTPETSKEQRGRFLSFSQKLELGLDQLKQRAAFGMESVRTRLAPITQKGVKMARASREKLSPFDKVGLGLAAIGFLTVVAELIHDFPYAVGWKDSKDFQPLVIPAVFEMFEKMFPPVSSVEDNQVPIPTLVQVTPEGTPLFVGVFPPGTAVVEETGEVIIIAPTPTGTPSRTATRTEAAIATATEALPAWQVLTEGGNLLAGGQWGRVEGVKVLPDGNLEIRGYGGEDGWNTLTNDRFRLKINGDFSISTEMDVNPETTYAGLEIFEAQPPAGPGVEWFNTKRLAFELKDGGSGLWIGYWNGTQEEAATLAEIGGLRPDPAKSHRLEVKFLISQYKLIVIVDGQSQIVPLPKAILEDDGGLRMGFNASPEAVLTVGELEILVPEGGEENVTISGLQTAATTVFVSPTPGEVIPTAEAAATAVVQPTVIPEPEQINSICEVSGSDPVSPDGWISYPASRFESCPTGKRIPEYDASVKSWEAGSGVPAAWITYKDFNNDTIIKEETVSINDVDSIISQMVPLIRGFTYIREKGYASPHLFAVLVDASP